MTDPTRRPNPNPGKNPAAGAPQPAPRPAAQPARAPVPVPARAPVPAPAPAPRARVAVPVEEEEPAPSRRSVVRRERSPGDEPLDSTTKKGLIVAGILVVIASIIWIVISNKHKAENDLIEGRKKELRDFAAMIEGADPTDPDKLKKAIDEIDANKTANVKWEGSSIESTISSTRSRYTGKIEELVAYRSFHGFCLEAEQKMANVANLTSQEMRDLRQKISDNDGGPDRFDPTYAPKFKEWKGKIDHVLVRKVSDEARIYAGSHADRTALAKFAAAEDDVRVAIERAKMAKNKADDEEFTKIYREELIPASDELTQKVVTPEFAESISWKDLLVGDNAAKWSKSPNVPGFSFRLEGGIITISPPDKDSKLQAFAGIGDQKDDKWRHLMVEMEFSIDGEATMYFHAPPSPATPNAQQSEAYLLSSKGNGLTPNQKYKMIASYIGSQLDVRFDGGDIAPYAPAGSYAKRRWGGIVFMIPEGTRMKITRMRFKELR